MVQDSNPSNIPLYKILTKIIRVIQKIRLTISPNSNTITPEKIVATIEQVDVKFQTIYSCVSMLCSFIFSKNIYEGLMNEASTVSPKFMFLETFNIINRFSCLVSKTKNFLEDWIGGFEIISSLMDISHILLQKMMQ